MKSEVHLFHIHSPVFDFRSRRKELTTGKQHYLPEISWFAWEFWCFWLVGLWCFVWRPFIISRRNVSTFMIYLSKKKLSSTSQLDSDWRISLFLAKFTETQRNRLIGQFTPPWIVPRLVTNKKYIPVWPKSKYLHSPLLFAYKTRSI